MAKPRGASSAPRIRLTLGIDEAGRGPAVGPMVMAAVVLDSRSAAALTRAGLCDSKHYGAGDDAHRVRAGLAREIRKRARFVALIEVEHTEIDQRVARHELNVLERELATQLIEEAPAVHRIIADGQRMFAALGQRYAHFESHDRAESRHASVAAASVIAKVQRDERFATKPSSGRSPAAATPTRRPASGCAPTANATAGSPRRRGSAGRTPTWRT